ncbi:MAG: family 20 glycosylhydrolase [Victivallales bacterium]|nr:family 20 glycosylhydrolase [Victivallales bacterium]
MSMQRMIVLMMACATAFTASAESLINGHFRGNANQQGIPSGWFNDSPASVDGTYETMQEAGIGMVRLRRATPSNIYYFRISQNVSNVEAGGTYDFSVWVKGKGEPQIVVYGFRPDGSYSSKVLAPERQGDFWQRIHYRFEAEPNATSFKISLIAGKDGEDVYFRDVSLQHLSGAPQCVLKRLSVDPENKMNWEDAVWREASESGPFTLLATKYGEPKAATAVRFGLYGKTLCILYRCEETDFDNVINGVQSWDNDIIEFFLEDPKTKDACHFGITSDGNEYAQVEVGATVGYYTEWYSNATNLLGKKKNILPKWHKNFKRAGDCWYAMLSIELPEQFFGGTRQCKMLFARSRKLKNLVENSTWGHTQQHFFRNSEGYVTVVIPAGGETAKKKTVDVPPEAKPNGQIVPKPKQGRIGSKHVRESIPLKVYAGDGAEKAFLVMERVYRLRFGVAIQKVENAKEAAVILKLTDKLAWGGYDKLKDWQKAEAYTLESSKTATLEATTHRGLVYAIQSLAQLSGMSGGQLFRLYATIQDWPDMQYRGWHVIAPETTANVPEAERMIDLMAALKMNWQSVQFDNRLKYDRHPDLSKSNAATKEQHKALGKLLDLYGMDVIPMTQCLSHFNYFLTKPEMKEYAEVKEPAANAHVKFWNYCPRHPEIHKIIFDLIEEQLECYPQAKWFHVGLDEITFEPFGVCDRCKGTSCGDLLAEEILRLHEFLKKKNLRMCMWGDQLLKEHNGAGKYNTAEALPKIPKDVVIFDWHYGEGEKYPSVEFFKKNGFDVISSGWYYPLNITNFLSETFKQDVIGFGGTTWYSISAIRESHQLMSGFVLAGERSWTRNDAPLSTLDYDVMEMFRKLYDGADARVAKKCRPLDIAPWCNMALNGDAPNGWLGLSTEYDVSSLPKGLGWYGGLPFEIVDAQKAAVALSCTNGDGWMDAAWQIPVGGKVMGLAFLLTTGRQPLPQRELYDSTGRNPRIPAHYVIHYEDGSIMEVPLKWDIAVSDWNTQFGGARAPIVWRKTAKDGTLVSLVAYTWWNPKPELAVRAIDFVTNRDKVQPVLLGVTAIEE